MINIFEIANIEDISPKYKGHDLVLNSSHMCRQNLENKEIQAPSPYYWQHYKKGKNPYLTKKHVISKDGWVLDSTIDESMQNFHSSTFWSRVDYDIDICRIGNDLIAMFQHPVVSYAQVIMKRNIASPFEDTKGVHDGKQIWFDLWTPYHDSVNEAERILTGYSLVSDPSDLQKALEFVERNLAVYKMMIFKQK